MFDIRHHTVSKREFIVIAASYLAIIVGLAIALFLYWPWAASAADRTGGARLNANDRLYLTPPRLATVKTEFPACPIRNDLTATAWLLVKNPEKSDREAVYAYLDDHNCRVLSPGTHVIVKGALRETRCVQLPLESYRGCYWTPQSALEE